MVEEKTHIKDMKINLLVQFLHWGRFKPKLPTSVPTVTYSSMSKKSQVPHIIKRQGCTMGVTQGCTMGVTQGLWYGGLKQQTN